MNSICIFDLGLKKKELPICIRDGTPGFRAPEIVLKSNYQDSKIDVYNIGLILACIMVGNSNIFAPKSDYHQLQQRNDTLRFLVDECSP